MRRRHTETRGTVSYSVDILCWPNRKIVAGTVRFTKTGHGEQC
jgi:hypothetical protein